MGLLDACAHNPAFEFGGQLAIRDAREESISASLARHRFERVSEPIDLSADMRLAKARGPSQGAPAIHGAQACRRTTSPIRR